MNVSILLFLSEISIKEFVKNTSVIFKIYFFSVMQFVLDFPLLYGIMPDFSFFAYGQNFLSHGFFSQGVTTSDLMYQIFSHCIFVSSQLLKNIYPLQI